PNRRLLWQPSCSGDQWGQTRLNDARWPFSMSPLKLQSLQSLVETLHHLQVRSALPHARHPRAAEGYTEVAAAQERLVEMPVDRGRLFRVLVRLDPQPLV